MIDYIAVQSRCHSARMEAGFVFFFFLPQALLFLFVQVVLKICFNFQLTIYHTTKFFLQIQPLYVSDNSAQLFGVFFLFQIFLR